MNNKKIINILVVVTIAIMLTFLIYAYKYNIFTSEQSFESFVTRFGWKTVLIFILIQITTIVIPVLPTSIGCIVGVVLFGPWYGFIYNYIAICIGSIAAFGISRHYGLEFVQKIVPSKLYAKYIEDSENSAKFDKLFCIAILVPGAPDDILCYLAGVTQIRVSKFVGIILFAKPISILLYSLGIGTIINYFN